METLDSHLLPFMADEWKHWILIYSLYALHELIPDVHYKCWSTFVFACRLLCLPIVTRTQINEAHILLADFCGTFERLYGKEACTPSMHMSLHLKECMLEFGPFSAFWCFPFERYNGILEGFKKIHAVVLRNRCSPSFWECKRLILWNHRVSIINSLL